MAALALLVPGLLCLTTVGRLWYLPGLLNIIAGVLTVDSWTDTASVVRGNWLRCLLSGLGACQLLMAAGSIGVLSLVGVGSGIALIAAALWPYPQRWALLVLIIIGTIPFAALAWTALVPVMVVLVTAARGGTASPRDRSGRASGVNRFDTGSTRAPLHNRMLIRLLSSRLHRLVDGSVVVLRVHGVVKCSMHELPVSYAVDSTGYVMYPARPATKRWWRNLRRPAQLMLLHGSCWHVAIGVLLRPGAPGYEKALHDYRQRWSKMTIDPADALVHVSVTEPSQAKPLDSELPRNG